MSTPVALIIFNRPACTQRVFDAIRQYRPSKLLVIADGPRSANEAVQCLATRSVIEQVDWGCDVRTNYSDVNLGCKYRVSSGLDWVFQQVEEAIVLEDDCVPHPLFFRYCEELLNKYRFDRRVTMISGTNLNTGEVVTPYSYYFSRYVHIWGWATWRRAWRHYDVQMSSWPDLRDGPWLRHVLADASAALHWRGVFDVTLADAIDTWDFQWVFANWIQNGLATVPRVNLVSNIGFGDDATHTVQRDHPLANLPSAAIDFPIVHPPRVMPDRKADWREFRYEHDAVEIGVQQRMRWAVAENLPPPVRRSLRRIRFMISSNRALKRA